MSSFAIATAANVKRGGAVLLYKALKNRRSQLVVFNEAASIELQPQRDYDTFLNLIDDEDVNKGVNKEPVELPNDHPNEDREDGKLSPSSISTVTPTPTPISIIAPTATPAVAPVRASSRAERVDYGKLVDPWKKHRGH